MRGLLPMVAGEPIWDSADVAKQTLKGSPSGSAMGRAIELVALLSIWRMTELVVTGDPAFADCRSTTMVSRSESSPALIKELIRQQDCPSTV